jgi:CBS domain-containing protein
MPATPLVPNTRRTRLDDLRVRDLMTGAAPVVNDAGRVVGVLSRSDVLLAVNAGVEGAPVREVMSPAVIAVRPDANAGQAYEVLLRCAVRRVFVTDEEGVPVGVVSVTDLFRGLMSLWGNAPAAA